MSSEEAGRFTASRETWNEELQAHIATSRLSIGVIRDSNLRHRLNETIDLLETWNSGLEYAFHGRSRVWVLRGVISHAVDSMAHGSGRSRSQNRTPPSPAPGSRWQSSGTSGRPTQKPGNRNSAGDAPSAIPRPLTDPDHWSRPPLTRRRSGTALSPHSRPTPRLRLTEAAAGHQLPTLPARCRTLGSVTPAMQRSPSWRYWSASTTTP